MANMKEHKVGIYVRLSNEDARAGESVSVENQKLMLTKHVKEMGWELTEIYIDDGWSGTNQNRPAFQRMIADVKQGFINTILIKDLSRLGRNYLEVGNLAEVFLPEHNCELISLNEKLDEMAVFRNWFNEQHSKTTSKKVRAVHRICAESGKFMGAFAPYGYQKDPADHHRLIADETAAPNVRRMFELRASGMAYRAIADKLNNDGVTSPKEYFYDGKSRSNPRKSTQAWGANTVKRILESETYIGNMIQCKTGTVSYKNHKLVGKPEEEWIKAEDTHEPLVSIELWDRVQSISKKQLKPRQTKQGEYHLFSGILVCADCGCKLRGNTARLTRKSGNQWQRTSYCCGTYARAGKSACSYHGIDEETLIGIVAGHIREKARMVECNENRIIESILAAQKNENMSYRAAYQGEAESHKKHIERLDLLIENLYNDRVTGVVPEDMFKRFVAKYEQERIDRLQSVETLTKRIQAIKQNTDDASAWANLIKRYTQLETLDCETLRLLIDRIVIGESRMEDGERVRDVKIIYNYVGDVDALEIDGDAENLEAAISVREAVAV